MLLTIDIGNTNITLGAFEAEELRATWRLSTESRWQPDEYSVFLQSLLSMKGVSPADIDAVIICSVVPPLTAVFEETGQKHRRATRSAADLLARLYGNLIIAHLGDDPKAFRRGIKRIKKALPE